MNAQVISSMQILEIEDMSRIPLMKMVRKQFLKFAKAKHPDGGVGTEEDFVELLDAKDPHQAQQTGRNGRCGRISV